MWMIFASLEGIIAANMFLDRARESFKGGTVVRLELEQIDPWTRSRTSFRGSKMC